MNDKLNKTINNLYYILDCLNSYKEIINSGDCNSCFNNKYCKYKPKLGQLVRYNCPFYLNYNEGRAKNNGF